MTGRPLRLIERPGLFQLGTHGERISMASAIAVWLAVAVAVWLPILWLIGVI